MGQQSNAAPDEQTPLLANSVIAPTADPDAAPAIAHDSSNHDDTISGTDNDDDAAESDTIDPEDKPLPKTQLFLICFARLVEPISFFGIFPFINQMVQHNGHLPEEDVGFYSGLNESLFSLTQMLVMIFWGRMADRFGRKPVLVTSLYGVAITVSLFGFAKTLWQMILFRCLSGVFAGSIVTIRTMVSELSTQRTQARAFSIFAFTGNIGILLGPLIGGALADPAHQYPRFFSHIAFCRNHPYALATVSTGAVGFIAATITAIFVKETRSPTPSTPPTTANAADGTLANDHDATTTTNNNNNKNPTTTLQLLRHPGVLQTLYLYSHVMLLAFAYTAIVPLFWFTSVPRGGFSFSPSQISIFMGLTGFAQAVWLLLVFPPLHDRFGTVGVTKACGIAYPFFFTVNPALNFLLRLSIRHHPTTTVSSPPPHTTATLSLSTIPRRPHRPGAGAGDDDDDDGTPFRILFWILAPALLSLGAGVSMSFTSMQLALNDVSPSPATLGTLNALALTLLSGLRSVSPWLFTSLFAVGARTQVAKGYVVWIVLVVLAAAMGVAAWRVMPGIYEGIEARKMKEGMVGRRGGGAGKMRRDGGGGGGGVARKKKTKKVRESLRRGRSEHV